MKKIILLLLFVFISSLFAVDGVTKNKEEVKKEEIKFIAVSNVPQNATEITSKLKKLKSY